MPLALNGSIPYIYFYCMTLFVYKQHAVGKFIDLICMISYNDLGEISNLKDLLLTIFNNGEI